MFRVISILLMLSLSFQSLVKIGILTWYELNKEYVANNLCENRSKPKLHCNGKCYLNKQLKKTDGNTDARKTAGNERLELLECVLPETFSVRWQCFDAKPLPVAPYSNTYRFLFSDVVFHPPSVIAIG